MGIVPIYVRGHFQNADNRDRLVARSEQPALPEIIEGRRTQFRRLKDKGSYSLERIVTESRVLIVEGITGAGKDTFQAYLKEILEDRDVDVYDYSEGEVLHGWKQMQIEGICSLRIAFMKLFVNYVRDIVNRDEKAVFLLNRFHLSTYASTIIRQPNLEREYDEIINVLRELPVHVFILQLDENEIDRRSSHQERSSAWRKFQAQMLKREDFRNNLERYIWFQKVTLEMAKRQRIPYSLIKIPSAPENVGGWVHVPEAEATVCGVRVGAGDAKTFLSKRRVPQTVQEDN